MPLVARTPPVAEGDVIAGKYRVDRVLGHGGMGVVVAATHTALDQRVALKFILPDALRGPESVERFLREAKASVRLKSEHVARVYDVGKLDASAGASAEGAPFIVMELLEGTDLAKLAKRVAPVPVADAAEYVLQACEALIEAHAHGIVHRDLKPQNLFVCRRMNGSPLVKVLDFGIFKATGPAAIGQMALTDSSVVLGSPLYMSPEQMRAARNADARSDIWSLGVILYELLGGRPPFDGETVTELCLKVTNDPPAPLGKLRDGLPDELVALVMRCLEKNPQKRFATVAQLAAALEPFSASAQRGALDRPWRSLVDTVDQLELSREESAASSGAPANVSGEPAASAPHAEKAGTGVTWGAMSQGVARSASPRKRGFVGGIAVGVAVSLVAASGAYVLATRAPRAEPVGSSSAPVAAAPPPRAETAPPASSGAPAVEPAPPAPPATAPVASARAIPASTARPRPAPPAVPRAPRPSSPAAPTASAPAPQAPAPPPPSAAPAAPPADPPAPPRNANGAPILK